MQNTIKQRFDLQYMTHTMNTTYRHTKQVTRMMARCSQGVAKVYPRCTQALGRLMSMLRVWLEYASKQKIYSHTGNKIFPPWEQNIPSLGIKRASCVLSVASEQSSSDGSSFPCSSCWYWEAPVYGDKVLLK